MNDMAADLAGLLDALGLEKAAVAGHSMGGYVALSFARDFPNRVSGLALVGSQSVGDTPERKEGRYKTASDVEVRGIQVVADAMTEKLSATQPVRDFVRSLILRQSVSAVTGALKAMAEREDLTPFIISFPKPVLLIHGSADELIPVDRAREIKLLRVTADLVELEGAGHMPMLEQPKETAEALKKLK
jgi:pimeloyl-ACP methyl ester carboxylesterase